MTIHIRDIELSKLVPSKANVRRTGKTERIEELAASISAHGLLQNLTVRPVEKERFEVVAGGRRLAALKLLAKRKEWAKDAPVPCQIIDSDNLTEISLAENALQCPMHPADQYEAFAELHRQEMSVEDIAARFGVSPKIVTQRLKLGAVSPKLMKAYRAGDMNLEQLSAFAITDDHSLQERVWKELGYNKSRHAILEALNDGQVSTDDRRALYVGAEAYLAAGGHITHDLFDEEGGGYMSDAALLNRSATEKLAIEAEAVSAEGWKWVAVELAFDYGMAAGMRRIYPEQRELTEEEDNRVNALEAQYETLCDEAGEEESEKLQGWLSDIDREIASIRGDDVYAPEDRAIAGVFVSLGSDGQTRIERGFVRREDDPRKGGKAEDGTGSESGKTSKDDLPARLVAELTAYRTVALANELAQQPGLALTAVVHALAIQTFYPSADGASCLKLNAKKAYLQPHAEKIADNQAMIDIEARDAAWEKRLPEDPADLWGFILTLLESERLELLAHCISLTLDAVRTPIGSADSQRHVDTLATALNLDMAVYWQPTAAGYFGRIAKQHILQAVREGVSPQAAENIAKLKKPAMAERAEKLLSGKGWLPELLCNAAQ